MTPLGSIVRSRSNPQNRTEFILYTHDTCNYLRTEPALSLRSKLHQGEDYPSTKIAIVFDVIFSPQIY